MSALWYRPGIFFDHEGGHRVRLEDVATGFGRTVLATALVGLTLAGARLPVHDGSAEPPARSGDVSILEGSQVSALTLPAGKITPVVVNKARDAPRDHGHGPLAEAHADARGRKTARLTLTLGAGSYHIWDPVRSA